MVRLPDSSYEFKLQHFILFFFGLIFLGSILTESIRISQ